MGTPHVRHRFAGIGLAFFSGASIAIVLPSAVAVFAWIATIRLGRPVITTAFLFFSSMILLFVIGGVSGFMTASVPVDWQLTDTYFVVAHLHYVLIGINVFPVVGATYFWFPKMTAECSMRGWGAGISGPCSSDSISRFCPCISRDFSECRAASTPMPMTAVGGMLNLITSIGSFVFAVGVLLLLVNVVKSLKHGPAADKNPWDAPTLEWSVTSPPPPIILR